MESSSECNKCNGTRRIKEKDGTIHICYDCLNEGRMDVHDKHPKTAEDFKIKL